MIDWINKISYTGFYHWLILTVHPLVMIVAVTTLTLGAAFYYTRRVISSPAESRAEAHLFPAVVIPIWTIFAGWVTSECFRVHGVNAGEPLIVVSGFSFCLYFLAGCMGIALGFKEESE
nr:MAG TPA: hypothetical protein [Caudoviricetes sp.]